jgi:hypothetical protein
MYRHYGQHQDQDEYGEKLHKNPPFIVLAMECAEILRQSKPSITPEKSTRGVQNLPHLVSTPFEMGVGSHFRWDAILRS